MSHSKNQALVLAVTEAGMAINDAAERFDVTTRWVRILLNRQRDGGLASVSPRSKRPHTSPTETPAATTAKILQIRAELRTSGLDAGAESIHQRLPSQSRPLVSTIWRILREHQKVTPQPQKRPRSSWRRFEAEAPNETWQSDITHWPTAEGTDTEIISWLDDHSRYLLNISAYRRVTGTVVTETFLATTQEHGLPGSTLTDNGMVYTTRLARGAGASGNHQPNGFEHLLRDFGIDQKNGAPGHPRTQGKIERFHQTLKRWLAQADPAEDLGQLQDQLQKFQKIYNHQRPHRGVGRMTPAAVYQRRPKVEPHLAIGQKHWRVRYDVVDDTGTVSLRYAGKLRHLGIGRVHQGARVLILIGGAQTMVVELVTGEVIAEHLLNSQRNYQAKQK